MRAGRLWNGRTAVAAIGLTVGLALAGGTAAVAQPQAPVVVSARDVTVITGAIFRVGGDTYEIAGLRAPRVNRAQCLYERLRGREARKTLTRVLNKARVEIIPTGRVSLGGARLAHVRANGQSVRKKMIEAGVAVPRAGHARGNPWCVKVSN